MLRLLDDILRAEWISDAHHRVQSDFCVLFFAAKEKNEKKRARVKHPPQAPPKRTISRGDRYCAVTLMIILG